MRHKPDIVKWHMDVCTSIKDIRLSLTELKYEELQHLYHICRKLNREIENLGTLTSNIAGGFKDEK